MRCADCASAIHCTDLMASLVQIDLFYVVYGKEREQRKRYLGRFIDELYMSQ